MRSRIDVLLVVRRGGDQLSQALESLIAQRSQPERLLVVDTSADPSVAEQIQTALTGALFETETLSLPSRTPFPDAVNAGCDSLFPAGQEIDSDRWLWLLRDDIVCHESALSHLVASVEGAPLIKVAGPKQRRADRPGYLRELGETLTPWGRRIALAERELDQGQYDRLSDVLAVGEAGMLIQADALRDIGGFDPALPALDAGLDVGIRVRLKGHRIVVVPRAVIDVGYSSVDWNAGKDLSRVRHDYLSTKAWLYRRLVYAPLWAFLPVVLSMLPWAILRGLGHLVAKRPDRMVSEPLAAIAAIGLIGPVLTSRSRLRASRTTSWDAINALRMDVREVLKKRAIAREEARASLEEKGQVSPAPRALPQLPWLVLALLTISGAVFGSWWGANALIGGGALPLATSLREAWASAGSFTPTQWGFDALAVPADPAALLFALLGSLLWWAPNSAVVWLFLLALPLAGAIAWWGFSHVFTQSWTSTGAAFLWAVSPTFLLALSEGRIGAVLAHLALPWLLGSLLSAHQSWQRVGTASLAAVVVTAGAPVLFPALIIGVIALVVFRGWGTPLRVLTGVLPFVLLPSLLLATPRFISWWGSGEGRWWENWGVLLADPGAATPFAATPWWMMALGTPSALPGTLAVGSGSELLVLAIMIGMGLLFITALVSLGFGRNVTSAAFAGLFGLGVITASASPALFSGFDDQEAVFVWPGTGVSLLVLGILVGAGSLLDRVKFKDVLDNPRVGASQFWARSTAALVIAASIGGPVIIGAQIWSGEARVQPSSAARTLPAFVQAEAQLSPQVGTLVISPGSDGYHASLQRGAGETLATSSTLVRGRSLELLTADEDLARLTAMLVRPSSAEPLPLLQEYGIRFVLVTGDLESEAALSLARKPGLVSASTVENGQLWQAPAVTVEAPSAEAPPLNLWNQLFLLSIAMVGVLAIPTERRVKASDRRVEDAIAHLGEETADNV